MQVLISVPDDTDAVRALTDWLRQEPDLRGVRIKPVDVPVTPGQLGVWSDAIELVSGNTELLTAVATVLGLWLSNRVRRTKVRIRSGEHEVEIEADRSIKPEQIARRIINNLTSCS